MKAKFVITLGDDEVQNGKAKMKNMKTGEEVLVQLNVNDIIEKI